MGDTFDPETGPGGRPVPGGFYTTVILWLIVLSGAILFIPLWSLSRAASDEVARLDAYLQAAQATLDSRPASPAAPGTDVLNPWPAILSAIGDYDRAQIALLSMAQTAPRVITLRGRARDEAAVRDYAHALEKSGLFSRVTVEAAGPAPTPPAAPPFPSPTAIEYAHGDSHEVDDFAPQPILVGQVQEHTFFPIYDVDTAQFTARAGRIYRISTARLSPTVNTALIVYVGNTIYQNDDRAPGDPASEVIAPAGVRDAQVIIYVTNRGTYGPQSGYSLLVEEVQPTPTPLPTSTRPPAPRPSPTHTPFPTALPTPFPSVTPESPAPPTPGEATPFPTVTPDASARPSGRAAPARAEFAAFGSGIEFVITLEVQGVP